MRQLAVIEEPATPEMQRTAHERTREIVTEWQRWRGPTGYTAPLELLVQSAYFQGARDMAIATMATDVHIPRRARIVEYTEGK